MHSFQRPSWRKVAEAWRGSYQLALSTPVLAAATLRASALPVVAAIRTGTARRGAFTADDLLHYGSVLQQPDRARASVQIYRTFVFREAPTLGQYLDAHLVVPTQLIVGEHDPVARPALLDGWQANTDEMTVTRLRGVGHFVPEEAADDVAEAVVEMP